MAFEQPNRSSSRSTLTSIASILERSIPIASSYDRLSFKSVAKDDGSDSKSGKNKLKKPKADMCFRAISPALEFKSLPITRAPPLEHAKSCTPSIYQQMAVSELDLVDCGTEDSCGTNKKEKTTNGSTEKPDVISNQLREPETADLIDLSDNLVLNCSGADNLNTLKKRVGFTDYAVYDNSKPRLKQLEEKSKTKSSTDDAKISTFSDLVSLTCEPKVIVLPTIEKEESCIYHRKPGFTSLPEESSQKARRRNINSARFHQQLTLSSDDSSYMAADSDCPIHGHQREEEDVTVSLSNPMLVGESSPLDSQAIAKHTTSTVMSKKSTDSRRYKHMQGSDKSSNSASADLLNDEDYYAGVTYSCKYIGSMSMMKPTSKVEILSAMRRVRIEYKTRNTKKKKVLMEIGVNGVKVRLNKRKRKELMDASRDDLLLMEEPIHHIFYVSHDSHDNKIFSYISKKNPSLSVTSAAAKTNALSQQTEPTTFHCHVFKAYKRLQAVLIIQGLGRIFTICQFLPKAADAEPPTNGKLPEVKSSTDPVRRQSLEDSVFLPEEKSVRADNSNASNAVLKPNNHKADNSSPREKSSVSDKFEQQRKKLLTSKQKSCDDLQLGIREEDTQESPSLTQQQEVQLLWLQVEHQEQQIGLAVSEMEVLKQQVAIESQARNDAEVRCHQLLLHNKDLLEHINRLVVENKQLREKINPDHNVTQPILSSTHTTSPGNSKQVKDDTSQSVKTSPDSGHKEMSARSSQSDIIEEWEKLNTTLHTLTTRTNSSYQLSSKFEQEMLQKKLAIDRDFSFTDMAKLRLSQSQLPSHQANQPEGQSNISLAPAGQSQAVKHSDSVDQLDQLIKQLDDEAAEMKTSNGLTNQIDEDKLHIANHSFSDNPLSTPVVPHSRTPNATKLLRDLMLNNADSAKISKNRSIRRIYLDQMQACDPETRSRSLNSSVNDIYDKMKVIRRSIENMETSVGKHLSSFSSVPSNEFTPQRKNSLASSTPASGSSDCSRSRLDEHPYTEVNRLKHTISKDSLFSEPDENVYEPIEGRYLPNREVRVTVTDTNEEPRQNPTVRATHKLRRSHHYENVSDHFTPNENMLRKRSPLKRNETYLIRRSATDLSCRGQAAAEVFDRRRLVYRSCQTLSQYQRYPNAPQKVTTLTSPGNESTKQYGLRRDRAQATFGLNKQFHTDAALNSNKGDKEGRGYPIDISNKTNVRPSSTSQSFQNSTNESTSFDPQLRETTSIYSQIDGGPGFNVSVRRASNDLVPMAVRPELALSQDSLETSVFEEGPEQRLENLIRPGITMSQSSC